MTDPISSTLETLLELARSRSLVHFNRINGNTVTFQIGRGLYAMERSSAVAFLQDLLRSTHAEDVGRRGLPWKEEVEPGKRVSIYSHQYGQQ